MLRKFVTFLIFISALLSFAQEEVPPVSLSYDLEDNLAPLVLPPLDLTDVIAEDNINDKDKSLPWRYGIQRSLRLNTDEHGVWTQLENGDRVWRIAIKSPNALNLSFNFDQFRLPLGSRLHFYNEDYSDVSKTYTQFDNRSSNTFGSWFINGDTVWIEYYEPSFSSETTTLYISDLIHGYRMGAVETYADGTRGLNDSGDCNYDVNCGVGNDFEIHKQVLKKSVALLNLGNGYLCSAVLMNNTSQDKAPYILTGNHCLDFSDPTLWSVRFNWISPNPVCANTENSTNIENNFTLSGASVVANNDLSDFALVKMFNDIPNSWNVVFAGWDNSDNLPDYEVGIHHPNGDIMKICRDDSGAVKENANGVEVWLIEGVSVGNGNGWEMGTTEAGSSGSPLFNQNGHLIGQLYAGLAGCDGTAANEDYDIYGRFGISWDNGSTPENRLREWLDPLETGQITLEPLENILNIEENEYIGDLQILPNPATTIIEIQNNQFPKLRYAFYDLQGRKLRAGKLSNALNYLNIENYSEGIYLLHLVDEDSKSEVTKKIIIER